MKPEPRYLLIVLALAGDSTMTSCLPSAEAPADRLAALFRVDFFAVALDAFFRAPVAFDRVVFVFFFAMG